MDKERKEGNKETRREIKRKEGGKKTLRVEMK